MPCSGLRFPRMRAAFAGRVISGAIEECLAECSVRPPGKDHHVLRLPTRIGVEVERRRCVTARAAGVRVALEVGLCGRETDRPEIPVA